MLDLTQGNVLKRILQFSAPLLLGNLFQQLYGIVDAIIVGKFVGNSALTAVVNATQIIFSVIAMIIGLVIGGTIVVAQYFGQKNYKKVQDTSDTLHLFFFIASLAVTIFGLIFTEHLVDWIQIPKESRADTITYLHITFIGIFGMFGYNASSAILRGVGDSKTPLYAIIIASILNLCLDLLFVLWFRWSVFGVGLATVISQFVAWIFIVYYVNGRNHIIKLRISYSKFDRQLFWQSFRIGFPTGAQQVFVALGMSTLLGIINSTGGVSISAGYGIAIRLETFILLPAMNFAMALSTFTGQNIGAGNISRVREGLRKTLWVSTIISLVISIIFFFLAQPILTFFMHEEDIAAIIVGADYFTVVSCFYVLFNAMFIINGVHRGAGVVIVPTLITLFSLWIIRVPLASFFAFSDFHFFADNKRYLGIFWSIPIAWFTGLIATIIYYKSGKWKQPVHPLKNHK